MEHWMNLSYQGINHLCKSLKYKHGRRYLQMTMKQQIYGHVHHIRNNNNNKTEYQVYNHAVYIMDH